MYKLYWIQAGSPVTIVSAKFLFQALGKHRLPDQTVEEWKDSVRQRLQYSSVKLKSYRIAGYFPEVQIFPNGEI